MVVLSYKLLLPTLVKTRERPGKRKTGFMRMYIYVHGTRVSYFRTYIYVLGLQKVKASFWVKIFCGKNILHTHFTQTSNNILSFDFCTGDMFAVYQSHTKVLQMTLSNCNWFFALFLWIEGHLHSGYGSFFRCAAFPSIS